MSTDAIALRLGRGKHGVEVRMAKLNIAFPAANELTSDDIPF